MASRLTGSSARMGTLEPEPEILETHDTPLDLPEDRLQEDAPDTTCAPGNSQPAATEANVTGHLPSTRSLHPTHSLQAPVLCP